MGLQGRIDSSNGKGMVPGWGGFHMEKTGRLSREAEVQFCDRKDKAFWL